MKGEIIIKFPKPTRGISLISSEDIKAHYESIGKTVPFTFVGLPYAQIDGKYYAVLPLPESEIENESRSNI